MVNKNNNSRILIPKYHWKPDLPDTRDYIYLQTNPVTPTVMDLKEYCLPIESQENSVSCTSEAIASAIELLNRKNNISDSISRLFINYHERLTKNYNLGASIRDGLKSAYKYGTPLEKFWPYNINKLNDKPNIPAMADSLKRKITLYEKILDHDGCIDCITNGYPVIAGFHVYSSFEKSNLHETGLMPYPDTSSEQRLGGHAVLLVGYDKINQLYIARNNRGSDWGDNGYFYMPFDVIRNPQMSGDFWAIKSVSNPEQT